MEGDLLLSALHRSYHCHSRRIGPELRLRFIRAYGEFEAFGTSEGFLVPLRLASRTFWRMAMHPKSEATGKLPT